MNPFHELFRSVFPRLTPDNYRITSPATEDYNCISWAFGLVDGWRWPVPARHVWPAGVAREETIPAFVAAFTTAVFVPCDDSSLEPGIEKVALYALNGVPTHAARQLPSGWWTSKLGMDVDVEHDTLDAIAGGVHGEPVLFLARPLASAGAAAEADPR